MSRTDDREIAEPHLGTRIESVEEIRQALQGKRVTTAKEPALADTTPFRPSNRPPLAFLCIFDDSGEDGEWIRLRGETVVIGRAEGDVVIPHDPLMSGRHAELSRQLHQGRYRWVLTDLGSTNGTFVRIGGSALKHHQELLIGAHHFRFETGQPSATAATATEEKPEKTKGWQSLASSVALPSLVELSPEGEGEGQRYLLTQPDAWIGRDKQHCAVALSDDPLVSPRHARLYRDAKDRWSIENAKSLNGTWLRIEQIPLESTCQFQLGEQRFQFRVS